jgi:hypothetical protein
MRDTSNFNRQKLQPHAPKPSHNYSKSEILPEASNLTKSDRLAKNIGSLGIKMDKLNKIMSTIDKEIKKMKRPRNSTTKYPYQLSKDSEKSPTIFQMTNTERPSDPTSSKITENLQKYLQTSPPHPNPSKKPKKTSQTQPQPQPQPRPQPYHAHPQARSYSKNSDYSFSTTNQHIQYLPTGTIHRSNSKDNKTGNFDFEFQDPTQIRGEKMRSGGKGGATGGGMGNREVNFGNE